MMKTKVTIKMTGEEYAEFRSYKLLLLLHKKQEELKTKGTWFVIGIYENGALASKFLTHLQARVVFSKFKVGLNDREIKRISDFIDKQHGKW